MAPPLLLYAYLPLVSGVRRNDGDAARQPHAISRTTPSHIRPNERISTSSYVFCSSRSEMKLWVEVSGINMESCLISAGLTLIKDSEVGAWLRDGGMWWRRWQGRRQARRGDGSEALSPQQHCLISRPIYHPLVCLMDTHRLARFPFTLRQTWPSTARDELASISPHFSTHYPSAETSGALYYLSNS